MDLQAIKYFTSDSLLLLRAMMDATSRAPDTRVSGNLPRDPTVAAEFKASGFFEGFAKPPDDLPQPKGLMKKKSDSVVYARVAADLVDFASRQAAVTQDSPARTRAGADTTRPVGRTKPIHSRWASLWRSRLGIGYGGVVTVTAQHSAAASRGASRHDPMHDSAYAIIGPCGSCWTPTSSSRRRRAPAAQAERSCGAACSVDTSR